jgi:hypothetical protein
MITRHDVAARLADYLYHRSSLEELVAWAPPGGSKNNPEKNAINTEHLWAKSESKRNL